MANSQIRALFIVLRAIRFDPMDASRIPGIHAQLHPFEFDKFPFAKKLA